MEHVTAKGVEIPAIGFGTARMDSEEEHIRIIGEALDAGYRYFDTAQMYGSEGALGKAISESDVDREDVFIATKLDNSNRAYDDVIESTKESLDKLETDYVDLLMPHSPNSEDQPPDEETLDAMNDLYDDGFAANLGTSNHSVEDLENAIEHSDAPIVANQELYNFWDRVRAQGSRDPHDRDLRTFCVENDIIFTAYSPLQVANVLEDDLLNEYGERYGKTAAQVGLRWLIEQPKVCAIPFSSSREHIRENIDVFDFELSDDEMRELFASEEELDDDLAAALGL